MNSVHFSLQDSVCQKVESGLNNTVSRRRSPSEEIQQCWIQTDGVCVAWSEADDLIHLPERRVLLRQKTHGADGSEPRRSDQSEDSGQRGVQVAGVSRVFTNDQSWSL